MDTKKFMDFMAKYELIYSVITELESYSICACGWRCKVPYDGLIETLFGNEQTVKGLNDSIEGEIMPQAMQQGNVICLLCKPKTNILVGLFYVETRDILESYEFGKKIDNEVRVIFNELKI